MFAGMILDDLSSFVLFNPRGINSNSTNLLALGKRIYVGGQWVISAYYECYFLHTDLHDPNFTSANDLLVY